MYGGFIVDDILKLEKLFNIFSTSEYMIDKYINCK